MGSWVGHLQTCGSEPPEHRVGDAGQAPAAGTWAPRSRVLGKWSPGAHLGRGCVQPPPAALQTLQHAFGAALLGPSHVDLPLLQPPCAGSAPMEVPGRLVLLCPMPSSLPGLQKVVWELAGRSLRLQLWRWRLPWLSPEGEHGDGDGQTLPTGPCWLCRWVKGGGILGHLVWKGSGGHRVLSAPPKPSLTNSSSASSRSSPVTAVLLPPQHLAAAFPSPPCREPPLCGRWVRRETLGAIQSQLWPRTDLRGVPRWHWWQSQW